MKRAIVSVISDLVTDQRVHRTTITVKESDYDVVLVGRKLKTSPDLKPGNYSTVRFRLWWEKGIMFYAAFNIRLFIYLLFTRADLLIANDLDTLLPNFLISRLKRIPLIYDSHEYFTEVPEMQHRPFVKRCWVWIEEFIFPKLKYIVTVNDSIAKLYEEKYGNKIIVIRNVPVTRPEVVPFPRSDVGIPGDHKVIIFQGSGINIHRGAEEALESMQYIENAVLVFAGGGDVLGKLKEQATAMNLSHKIKFIPRQTPDDLRKYTSMADLGLSLDKDTNINYRYSLPNKLFDYIHAGVPVLASDLPEVRKIVEGYGIGIIAENHDPKYLAGCIQAMLTDNTQREVWKSNLVLARHELCWEIEKIKLIQLIHAIRETPERNFIRHSLPS